jgi:hypothetical protein
MTHAAALTHDAQASLIASNDEYRRLHEEHVALEAKLREFASRTVLTDAEQFEEHRLKKLKLAGRDRMEAILRASHR